MNDEFFAIAETLLEQGLDNFDTLPADAGEDGAEGVEEGGAHGPVGFLIQNCDHVGQKELAGLLARKERAQLADVRSDQGFLDRVGRRGVRIDIRDELHDNVCYTVLIVLVLLVVAAKLGLVKSMLCVCQT